MCSRFIVERFTSANFSTGYVRLNSRYKHKQLPSEKSGTLLKKLGRESNWNSSVLSVACNNCSKCTHLDVPYSQRSYKELDTQGKILLRLLVWGIVSLVAEQGLYISPHTFVYSHVSHKQLSTPAPGNNNRQRQDQVEEKDEQEDY